MRKTSLKRYATINNFSEKQKVKIATRKHWTPIILVRQGGVCAECKGKQDWRGWQLHHITFLSHGGPDTPENFEVLCARCHDRKHGIEEANRE